MFYLWITYIVYYTSIIDIPQDVYHVGSGGTLDTPTVGLLSRPRCGNPDNVMEEPEADEGWQTLSPGSRYRRGAPQHSEAPGSDSEDTNIPLYHKMLHRMAAELREAANARHPKPDSHQEWEPHPHVNILASREAVRFYFHEIYPFIN